MAETILAPDEQIFEAQLHSARFVAGIEEGRWIALATKFPDLYVQVTAIEAEADVKVSQDFHLICDGLPMPGPQVERWNFERESRPAPPSTGSPGWVDALKDWGPGGNVHGGIYRAWSRVAAAHNEWAQKRPDQAWSVNRELAFIMERLHDLVAEQALWVAAHKAT